MNDGLSRPVGLPDSLSADSLNARPESEPRVLLSLSNVTRSYESVTGQKTHVLKGLNLDIVAGSFNVIRGRSGSGKTSLLRILGLLDNGFDGEHEIAGVDIKNKPDWYRDELRASSIGFIFQDGQLFAHLKVAENIALPVRLQGTREQRRMIGAVIEEQAPQYFEPTPQELGAGILSAYPNQLSGGQKQRAAVMRSMINGPAIILADEPTASLDEKRKQTILELLVALREKGHTIIVVSHDDVFYETGRQLELANGVLTELAPDPGRGSADLEVSHPASGGSILFGWWPRASFGTLIKQVVRETFWRPIFLFLVLVSLWAGVCQIGVFTSLIVGAQTFLNDAMTRGSRLNRVEIKPRAVDREKDDRFPVVAEIKGWPSVQTIVPRRATIFQMFGHDGETTVYSALGLHPDDPEYRLLTFVAGLPFSQSNEELEIIITAALVPDLFSNTEGLANGTLKYSDFIGKSVTIEVPQFAPTGQRLASRSKKVQLKIVGVILYGEGGRQIYLPNKTQLVFERYKRDRESSFNLPVSEDGASWIDDREQLTRLADFPWEDQVQVYTKEIRDIIPVFQRLSQLGYRPESEVWRFKWVLDIRDLAWKIFIPLLTLIVVAVALTVATNLFSSAKLREREFALWRILGMRRGDLVFTQVLSTIVMVALGAVAGLATGAVLIDRARFFLAEQNPEAGMDKVFAPLDEFYLPILGASILLGVLAAIWPSIRTAHSDPAKVLQS